MSRCLVFAVLLALPALGCGSKEPPVVSAGDPAANGTAGSSAHDAPATDQPSLDRTEATSQPVASSAKSGPALRDVIGRLLKSDGQGGWHIDEVAATDLEKLSPQPADLVPLLKDRSAEVRRGAAYSLQGVFNPSDDDQVAAMTLLVEDDDRMVRSIGLATVRQMRPQDQVAAAPRLATMLDPAREEKPENRASVSRLLGGLKTDAAAAFGPLAQSAAGDPDARVRAASLAALAQMGEPSQVGPLLINALSDDDGTVRVVAAARLRPLGPAAADAAQPLAAALTDELQSVRESAAETLIRIGPASVPHLIEQLSGSNLEARKLALFSLAGIGPAAKDALTAIERCKQDPDEDVRKLAALAANRIGGR